MSFLKANFAPLGNPSKGLSGVGTTTLTGAPSAYSYATADSQADVNTSGYFNDMSNILNVGDMIYAVTGAGSGGTMDADTYVVVSNASGVVDVSNGENITLSDSD